MSDGRILRIFRDGRRPVTTRRIQLAPGAEGNLTTLGEMVKIVREDAQSPDLRNFVFDRIIGIENKTLPVLDQAKIAFYFCRDKIVYEPEKPGYETIADLWSCLYDSEFHSTGDCAIKSTALATILCYLNLKPKFVALQQIPNADFFNHVSVAVELGGRLDLDPTPVDALPGQRQAAFTRAEFRI